MNSTKASHGDSMAEPFPTRPKTPSRTLSRSPHPYHRRSSSLKQAQNGIRNALNKYSESADSTESEERGTEADDEKGPILKGLPAPPLRGRKGLKGSKTPIDLTPAISPCPTPPAIKDGLDSYFPVSGTRRVGRLDKSEQQRSIEAYSKYVSRKRAELARRTTESMLFVLIGAASTRSAFIAGRFGDLYHELGSGLAVLSCLYLLFPLRIAFGKLQAGGGTFTALKTGFHIPSRFDPGPLIYPIFLPFLISVSCTPTNTLIMLTNIVLGIASLPQKILPFGSSRWIGYVHWLCASIPLINSTLLSRSWTSTVLSPRLDAEILILLFPLHEATLATLRYLTTTSLDPAEIQLLTVGLINLYLFTTSPQAEILKALLWVGALCIFVTCQRALSWELRLARIPSWRFARNKAPRAGPLYFCEHALNMFLPPNRYTRTQNWSSDDEDYEHLKSARKMARNHIRLRKTKTGGPQSDLEPIPSGNQQRAMPAGMNGLQRSSTVSANGAHLMVSSQRRRRSLNVPTTGMLSLTYTQAQACKWLISGYVFSSLLAIVLVVIRHYVSAQSLSYHEPFGWALGYLLGNIQPVRLWVVSNNLDTWISLPRHTAHTVVPVGCGWLEQLRQTEIGPANVRLFIASYCVIVLTVGIGIVFRLGAVVEVDTRRKVFHGIMVAMLLPTIFIDPCFIALALSLILAIFLLLDLFRASQLPPISKPLTAFLAPYVDGRDYRGPVIVSHIFLLIGCAIPVWLSLAGVSRTGQDPWLGWDTSVRELSMISGVVCVGMGDAAASLIGRRYGKTKWIWGGGKSLEGSLAFAVAVTLGLSVSYTWLRVGGWVQWEAASLPVALLKMALAGSGASLLETVLTAGNDNVIVPIGLWLLTRGLDI